MNVERNHHICMHTQLRGVTHAQLPQRYRKFIFHQRACFATRFASLSSLYVYTYIIRNRDICICIDTHVCV